MSRVKCDTEGRCEKDTTYLADVSGGAPCFALLDVEKGPVVSDVAISTCLDTYSGKGYPVHVRRKAELSSVLNWAISAGLPNDTDAGFWTGYVRMLHAPMHSDGSVNQEVRKNRTLFRLQTDNTIMPEELWRNESQPGHLLDKRDERCTAQSRPGQQPEYLGIDDYECFPAQMHYIVCQVELKASGSNS
ncbi:uncharacterized protein LOC142350384 [Convolutriloba macropyga]|uniref:uncharacterized protein LOC142350384 n=1 Tax=Convolutriloba macropyga TaxID=536237 RepID=UPI003F5210A0